MPTAEEHLRQDVAGIIVSYIFQLAIAKAEIDRLKLENAALSKAEVERIIDKESRDGASSPARVSE